MKVYIESYGCTFNKADGQIIAGNLKENGIDLVDSIEEASPPARTAVVPSAFITLTSYTPAGIAAVLTFICAGEITDTTVAA